MKHIRKYWSVIEVSVLAVLCIVALYISFNIARIDYQRKNQIVSQKSGLNKDESQVSGKVIQASKINDQVFYFNGELVEGVSSYKADKLGLMIPIDDVFRLAGIKYNYYASDDIFEATVNSKRLTVRLGQSSYRYGGTEYKLTAAPVATRDHILVPLELFTQLDGFKASGYANKGTAFINYSGDMDASKIASLKALRLQRGYSVISSIDQNKEYWSSLPAGSKNEFINGADVIESSGSGEDYLIKTLDKVFLIHGKHTSLPVPLEVSTSAGWSVKGNYLYWQDAADRNSYIYDIEKNIRYALGNYYDRIVENQGGDSTLAAYHSLGSFYQKNGAKAITLVNLLSGESYSSVEKKGKTLLDGVIDYSPMGNRILFKRAGKYFSATVDGSEISEIGDYDSVSWINNSRLKAYAEGNAYIMDYKGRSKIRTDSTWKHVGESLDGGVFFTGDNSLFIEKDGEERKIMDLPWVCSYAFAQKESGPYILQSEIGDGIYFTNGNAFVKAGKNSDMVKILQNGEFKADLRKSIVFSPNGDTAAILQKGNNFLSMTLAKPNGFISKKLVLNEIVNNKSEIANISLKWLSDSRLLVYTAAHGWIIEIGEGVHIFEWNEDPQNVLKGFMPN